MPRTATAVPELGTAGRSRHWRGLQDRPMVAVGSLVALGLLLPLVLVGVDATDMGWRELHQVLWRERTLFLLRHTVTLSALVVLLAGTIGTASAWLTERSRVPGRQIWTVLLVLPLAVPDFVVGYAWHSIAPTMNGLAAATLVMTLGTYPLVYLPVAAALRRADPALDDAAHSLGKSPLATFFRVTLPLLRTALIGGCLLVVLTVLSEYGAFEILRYQTFTTEIFTEFQFDAKAAGALSIPLVLLGLLALGGDALLPRRVATSTAPRRARASSQWGLTQLLGSLPVCVLVLLGVGVPLGTLVYWAHSTTHTTLPAAASLGQATWTSLAYSALGAAVAVGGALPVALMTFRRSSTLRLAIERSTFISQALPGVVVALSLVFFATRYAYSLYQTSALLVAAYAILHFPLALVCVKSSVSQAPANLADMGRSLGRSGPWVFCRVTLPLIAPGLLAGFCLVFLTAVTELTATLVLAPIGVQTLATQFWAFQSEVAYGAAAPYALVIVGLAALPVTLLARWFDRGPRRAQPAA